MEAGMADLGFAVKEKVTPDHDVIDEAIREEAEVGSIKQHAEGLLRDLGLHCLFHPGRHRLQTEQRQSQESEDQRLSWQSPSRRCIRPSQCLHRLRRLRGQEECRRRSRQGRQAPRYHLIRRLKPRQDRPPKQSQTTVRPTR